jgi:predicted RecA/RadA family phage recombinase
MFFSIKSYLRIRIALAGVMAVIFAFAPLFSIPDTQAAIPQTINYQSRLLTPGGLPVTSTTAIQLSFYLHPTNGSSGDVPDQAGPLVWKEVYDQASGACAMITPDAKGYFFLKLGSCSPFPSYLDFSEIMYVGVKIGADAEASPRVQLSSHPYALNAYRLNGYEATSTATANQLLALDSDLNFNIDTGTFTGAGLFISGTSTLQQVTFTVATGTSLNLTEYLAIGAIRLDAVGTNNQTSGAYLVGVFDEFDNSNATTVQAALFDLDQAITTVSSTLYAMDLQLVTDNGNITTNWIEFAGGTTTGDILPSDNRTQNLGALDKRWGEVYTEWLSVGDWNWWVGQNTGQNFGIYGTAEHFTIATNGNVGVGTVNPEARLSIDGNAVIGQSDTFISPPNGTDRNLTIRSQDGFNPGIQGESHVVFQRGLSDIARFGVSTANSMVFQRWNGLTWVSEMLINSAGNVGIGLLSPSFALDIAHDLRLAGQFMLGQYAVNPGAGYQDGAMIYNTVSSTPFFWDGTEWVALATGTSADQVTLDMAYNGGGTGLGRFINSEWGPIEIDNTSSTFGAMVINNINDMDVITVNNSGNGSAYYVDNTGYGIGFYVDNRDDGYGALIENFGTYGTGLYVSNYYDGYGMYLDNFGDNAGAYFGNSGSGAGVYIENNHASGTGLLVANSQGVGITVDVFASLMPGIKINNLYTTGNGIVIDNNLGTPISITDVNSKRSIQITKSAGGGNVFEIVSGGTANMFYSLHSGSGTGFWMRNTGTGNSIRIEDTDDDESPFVLDAQGNLAIGTSTTPYKLDVWGHAKVEAQLMLGVYPGMPGSGEREGALVYNSASSTPFFWDGTRWVAFATGTGAGASDLQAVTDLGNITTNWIEFAGGTSTNDITILGNVGINTPATSTYSLYISGGPMFGDYLAMGNGIFRYGDIGEGAYIHANKDDNTIKISAYSYVDIGDLENGNFGSRMSINGTSGNINLLNANVGIGTNSPTSLLHVQGGDNGRALLVLDSDDGMGNGADAGIEINSDYANGSDAGYVLFKNNGSESGKLFSHPTASGFISPNRFDFIIDGNISLSMLENGNVGINNNNPAYSLDMMGDARISAQLMLGRYAVLPASGHQSGAVVYNTASSSIHYWDGSTWLSLVDKNYVDNYLSSSAGNGLTWDAINNEIDLGGALTQSTNINYGNFDFRIQNANSYHLYNATNNASYFSDGVDYTNFLQNKDDITISGSAGFAGATYLVDYSANFTPRSLVDKAYVDNTVFAATTTLQAAYDAGGSALGRQIYTLNNANPVEILNPGIDQWETGLALTNASNGSGLAMRTMHSFGDRGAKLFFIDDTSDPDNATGAYMDWNEITSAFEFGYQTAGTRNSSFYIDYNFMSLNVPGSGSQGALAVKSRDYNVPVLTLSNTNTSIQMSVGTSTPEAKVTANRGSVYYRTDGTGSSQQLYVKTTDGTNTGWFALAGADSNHWQKNTNVLSPTDSAVYQIGLTNNSASTLTGFKAVNTNDASNYAGAVLELKGSGADFTNNIYFGKYGSNFYVPSWAGNGVLATDRNLVIGSVGTGTLIRFQVGGGYTAPTSRMTLDSDSLDLLAGVSLNVGGNTVLGDATSDTITFNARANSHVLPSVNNNYDLGSPSLSWRNIYASGTIYGNVVGYINPGYTEGSVIFQGASGLQQNNSKFYWDNTLNRLLIGSNASTTAIGRTLDVNSVALAGQSMVYLYNRFGGGGGRALHVRTEAGNSNEAVLIDNRGTGSGLSILNGGAGNLYGLLVDSGKVGFGTTTPAFNLDLIGDARLSAQLMLGQYAVNPAGGLQAGAMIYNTASSTPFFWDGGDWIAFATGTGGALTFQQMTDLGNITTNWIEFAGGTSTGNIIPGTHDAFTLGDTDRRWSDVWASDVHVGTSTWDLAQADNGAFTIGQNGGAEAMRILTNGNVGIGTNQPENKFTIGNGDLLIGQFDGSIVGPGGQSRQLIIRATDGSNPGIQGTAYTTYQRNGVNYARVGLDTSNNINFGHFDGSWSNKVVIATSGNMGIGVFAPYHRLHVQGSSTPGDNLLKLEGGSNGGYLSIYNNIVDDRNMVLEYARELYFESPSGRAATFNRLGYLSLADHDAVYKLDVDGDVRVSAELMLGRYALNPIGGLQAGSMIYNTNSNVPFYWNGTTWSSMGAGWALTGNSGVNPATNFLGTTDAQALAIRTNNVERIRVLSNGNVGIGTNTPSTELEVVGDIVSRGTKWTARSAGGVNYWRGVTYGNGLFVAVAYWNTSPRVMTSPDGINWTVRTAAAANSWFSIAYGNGLFVAVSTDGTNRVMTSPDGINWTSRTAAAANPWSSVTYGNGLFVAVSTSGSGNRVMTSPDGINWTSRASAADIQWRSVAYGNNMFVAVASSGSGNRVMSSPDGINWTIQTSAADNPWESVTYGNGSFVAVASAGFPTAVMTSPDGINWTLRNSDGTSAWYSVSYGDGLYVAVGEGDRIMTSPNGIDWINRPAASSSAWRSVVYGNGTFVAVAQTGANQVMTSGKTNNNALAHNNTFQGGMNIMSGNLGIGTSTPSVRLYAVQSSDTVAAFDRTTNDGVIISLRQDGTEEGTISVSGNTVSYNAFTGSHYAWTDESLEKGILVSLTGENRYLNDKQASEIIYGITKTAIVNDSRVMGAYLSLQEPSKAHSSSNPHLVMAVGNGEMWVADKGANVNIGDYFISSDVEGHAEKDMGSHMISHIVARAAESIDWTHVSTNINGVKHKKISVFFEAFDKNNIHSSLAGTSLQGGDDNVDVIDLVAYNAVFEGNVTVMGHVAFSEDTVGQAMVLVGDKRVSITFKEIYGTLPIVTLTPANKVTTPYWVENASVHGFDIVLDTIQYADVLFNWHAFGNNEGKVYVSNGTTLDIVTNDMGASELELDLSASGQSNEAPEQEIIDEIILSESQNDITNEQDTDETNNNFSEEIDENTTDEIVVENDEEVIVE